MKKEIKTKEYVIDAKGRKLGRLATEIAHILQGKDSPSYMPNVVAPNKVIIKNIDGLEITGKKREQKIYYKPSRMPGHLKERTYEEAFSRDPEWVIKHAVRLMLPKNRLSKERLKNLIVE